VYAREEGGKKGDMVRVRDVKGNRARVRMQDLKSVGAAWGLRLDLWRWRRILVRLMRADRAEEDSEMGDERGDDGGAGDGDRGGNGGGTEDRQDDDEDGDDNRGPKGKGQKRDKGKGKAAYMEDEPPDEPQQQQVSPSEYIARKKREGRGGGISGMAEGGPNKRRRQSLFIN
jgi:hypothetical protein